MEKLWEAIDDIVGSNAKALGYIIILATVVKAMTVITKPFISALQKNKKKAKLN
jgi:hypothetical protein